jgi:hypothetical protein
MMDPIRRNILATDAAATAMTVLTVQEPLRTYRHGLRLGHSIRCMLTHVRFS